MITKLPSHTLVIRHRFEQAPMSGPILIKAPKNSAIQHPLNMGRHWLPVGEAGVVT